MVSDIEVRKVVQDVLLFVWFKNNIITKEPSSEPSCIPGISSELIHNLRISVWLESKRIKLKYQNIVSSFWERMTCSPYIFANYVAYFFYFFCELPYACNYFFNAFALMAHLTEHCWQSEDKQYINASVDLFCAYFEKDIRQEFENQGGWERLNEFLEEVFALTKYRSLIQDNKCPLEYFNSFLDNVDQSDEILKCSFLNDFNRVDVENDEKANNFARSVEDRITELCKKEFDEILVDFERTDLLVRALYRKTLDVTDEQAEEVVHDSTEEIQKSLQDTSKIPMCGERMRESQGSTVLLQVQKSEDSQAVGASNKASNMTSKLSISGLLGEISTDISKLNGIVQSLCEKHGVKASVIKGVENDV